MILRRRYCSDRMCGATDCSTCYGEGYDREDDDEPWERVDDEDEEEPEEDDGPEPSEATP